MPYRPLPTSYRFLIPIAVMLFLGFLYVVNEETSLQQKQINIAANMQVQELSHVLTATESAVGDEVQAAMTLLKQRGNALGPAHQEGHVDVGVLSVPNIYFGQTPQANHLDLVDDVTKVMGGTATIFVKSGDRFIRIATNVESTKGVRGTGTFLDPEGKAIKALRSGKAFYGVVDILGSPYITGYEPMRDSHGDIIGAWYVGYKADLNSIDNIVSQSRFLKSGFQAVIDYRGTVRFHSAHITASQIDALLRARPSDWNFVSSEIPDWGYKVLTAYPKGEALEQGLKEVVNHFIFAAVFLAMLLGLIFRQMKQLVYRPLGGDPEVAAAMVHRISTGDFSEDTKKAPAGSLMHDLNIMRASIQSMLSTITTNREELELAASVFSQSHNSIVISDTQRKIIDVNPAFSELTGYSREEVLGKNTSLLKSTRQDVRFYKDMWDCIATTGTWSGEVWNRRKNGEDYIESLYVKAVKGSDGKVSHYVGISTDVTERKKMEDDLRSNEERFRYMLENSPIAVRIARAGGRNVIFANQRYADLINANVNQVVGADPKTFYVNQNEYESVLKQLKSGERVFNRLMELSIPGFGTKWALASYIPIQYENEPAVLGWFYDISDRKRAEEDLQLAALVYQNTTEAMTVTDAENRIIAVNPAFTKVTGYEEAEVLGKDPKILSSGKQDKKFYQAMWDTLKTTGYWQGEIWNKHKNGAEFIEWLSINTINNEDGSVHRRVALFSDITERKNAEAEIWEQANFDHLTRLPNRRLFHDRLDQEIKKAQRDKTLTALLFLDLDRFKEVNDSLGHDMGDLLLVEAATRIRHYIRECDTLARLGGDEFTVILSELQNPSNIERIATSIIESLSEPFLLNGQESFVSVSIGIALYPDDSTSVNDLIKHADQAMYAAKDYGRGRFHFFTKALQEAVELRMRLGSDLRNALHAGQFEVYYQPIIELDSGHINKAEALLRWKHPVHGFVSPAAFIPIAEDTGTIHEIGDWVFLQAAQQVRQWQSIMGSTFQISVNKSPVQFLGDDKNHNYWVEKLAEMGLPGSCIVVEITEGLLMNTDTNITQKLLRFREAGIQFAIDDFGTGYSALSYLKKFDIDYLKIDQSFTRNLAPNAPDFALCEAMVVMAHKLGIKVIAEGVETEEQRDLLKQIGCDYGQGYLFSKPVPVIEFEKLLANG